MNEEQLSTFLTTEQLDGIKYLMQIANDKVALANQHLEIQRLQNPQGDTPENQPSFTLGSFINRIIAEKGTEGYRQAFDCKLRQAAENFPSLPPNVQLQILQLAKVNDVLKS